MINTGETTAWLAADRTATDVCARPRRLLVTATLVACFVLTAAPPLVALLALAGLLR